MKLTEKIDKEIDLELREQLKTLAHWLAVFIHTSAAPKGKDLKALRNAATILDRLGNK